jgi:hypothetical protein
MKFLSFIFFFLVCTIPSFGQVHKGFRWVGPDHSLYSINIKNGLLVKEGLKKDQVELGEIQDWDSLKKDLPEDLDVNTFYQSDSLLLTIPGTGQLYNLDVATLKLNRIDQTFFRGYNFNAAQFIRKDTLFSVGGEGFWLRHSILTYYNLKTHEWDLYKSGKDNTHATNFKFSGYAKAHDAFFSAYLEPDSVIDGKKIHFTTYDFKLKKWETKGKISDALLAYTKNNYRSVWTGKYLILFTNKETTKILIADPFANKLYESFVTEDRFYLLNNEIYYRNLHLFSRSVLNSGTQDKVMLDSLHVDSLVNHATLVGNVYDSESMNSSLFIVGIIMLIASCGIVIYRKIKLRVSEIKFSEHELLVVKEFISKYTDKTMSSSELNNLLDLNPKSYDNQRQIRNRIISSINQKLFNALDAKDLIFRISNKEDKRMMDYYINPEIKAKDLIKIEIYLKEG